MSNLEGGGGGESLIKDLKNLEEDVEEVLLGLGF